MGLINLTCDKCGAALIPVKDGLYLCEHCNTVYKDEVKINSTTYNHNETIVKNYYGNASTTAQTKDKIDGYFRLVVKDFEEGLYREAKDFCVKIISIDPDNADAFAIRTLIEKCKDSKGTYQPLQSSNEILKHFVSQNLLGNSAKDKPCLLRILTSFISKHPKYIVHYDNTEFDNHIPFNKSKIFDELTTTYVYFKTRQEQNINVDKVLNYITNILNKIKQTYKQKADERSKLWDKYYAKKRVHDELLEEETKLKKFGKIIKITSFVLVAILFIVVIIVINRR